MLYADSRWLKWETLSKCYNRDVVQTKAVETSTLGPTRIDEVTAMRKILDMWWHMASFQVGNKTASKVDVCSRDVSVEWNGIDDVCFLQYFVG